VNEFMILFIKKNEDAARGSIKAGVSLTRGVHDHILTNSFLNCVRIKYCCCKAR
jgi:hypothetical protein